MSACGLCEGRGWQWIGGGPETETCRGCGYAPTQPAVTAPTSGSPGGSVIPADLSRGERPTRYERWATEAASGSPDEPECRHVHTEPEGADHRCESCGELASGSPEQGHEAADLALLNAWEGQGWKSPDEFLSWAASLGRNDNG